MLRIDRQQQTFTLLETPSLAELAISERYDLQEFICNSPQAFFQELGLDLFLIGKEIMPSQSVQDRIDLLAVDREGNCVIIELKRGNNKLQPLQAISYAGMMSQWTVDDFLQLLDATKREQLLDFLEVDIEEINRSQRIVLIAEAYDYALLIGTEWLSKNYGVDVISRVTQAQREALSTHKLTLLAMLTPPTTCYISKPPEAELFIEDPFAVELAERFAIQWAEATGTEGQVSQALADAIEFFEVVIDGREPKPKEPPPPPPPRYFDELKAAHTGRGIDLLRLEQEPQATPCRRCGGRQAYLAVIHGGESLRRDCASCGRFREFPAWKEKAKAEQILTDATEQARYTTKAGCSSAANTQATLTTSP